MLVQQLFRVPRFQSFLSRNFVRIAADTNPASEANKATGASIMRRFGIAATPTALILERDGAEVDWIVG